MASHKLRMEAGRRRIWTAAGKTAQGRQDAGHSLCQQGSASRPPVQAPRLARFARPGTGPGREAQEGFSIMREWPAVFAARLGRLPPAT
jgi:hypothetical protein